MSVMDFIAIAGYTFVVFQLGASYARNNAKK